MFVCLSVGIKAEKLYSASCWEGSKPPGSGYTRAEAPTEWIYPSNELRYKNSTGNCYLKKSPGHVSDKLFEILVWILDRIDPSSGRITVPWTVDEIRVLLPVKWLLSGDKFDMNY